MKLVVEVLTVMWVELKIVSIRPILSFNHHELFIELQDHIRLGIGQTRPEPAISLDPAFKVSVLDCYSQPACKQLPSLGVHKQSEDRRGKRVLEPLRLSGRLV
jgi:hypothetical protein